MTRVDVSVVAYAFDVAHDLGMPGEPARLDDTFPGEHGEAWIAMVLSRVHVQADGRPLAFVPVDLALAPGRDTVVVRMRAPVDRPASVAVDGWLFPYDPLHQTFVKVYEDGVLTAEDILTGNRRVAWHRLGARQSRSEIVRRFVRSGIEHIAIGPDHVLFLVGLLLAGGTLWQIAGIVTAFTVAHSVTLSAAVLGIVAPSPAFIEPAIALSICYVGVDNLLGRPGSRDRRAWVALGFGVIHGFGFASVLQEMALPRAAMGWSLLSFNAGVEIGQLVIVLVVSSALAWIARRAPAWSRRVTTVGSLVVLWVGFYWFIERVI